MCKCNPEIRTPFCGKINCEWPKPEGARPTMQVTEAQAKLDACNAVTNAAHKIFNELAAKEFKEGLTDDERIRLQRLHDIIVFGRALINGEIRA